MHNFAVCCNLVFFFIKIIKSDIFLGKLDFLGSHGAGVAKILDIVVRSIKEKGMMCTSPVIDALIQVCQFLGDLKPYWYIFHYCLYFSFKFCGTFCVQQFSSYITFEFFFHIGSSIVCSFCSFITSTLTLLLFSIPFMLFHITFVFCVLIFFCLLCSVPTSIAAFLWKIIVHNRLCS